MFRRAQLHYGRQPKPMTPYQKAARVWDDRIGSARVQAHNWRLIAFGVLLLAFLLAASLAWQAGRSRITPYVVEVNSTGQVRSIGPATEIYRPSDALIAHHLARFVGNVRALPTDPVVVRRNWLEAYDYAAGAAVNTLNAYARDHDPFAALGRESRTVEVTSVVRASKRSFELRWIERVYANGALARTERHTATTEIVLEPPRDTRTLHKNPLGIYVRALNWSRDFTTEE